MAQIETLRTEELDVAAVPYGLGGHYQLPDDIQMCVNDAVEAWGAEPGFATRLFGQHPSGAAWYGVAKRAVALHAFYNIGDIEGPADGIDPGALTLPLFPDAKAARDLLHDELGSEEAERVLTKYDAFFAAGSLRDREDEYGLTSHDYIAGCVDRVGDITRVLCAIDLVRTHIADHADRYEGRSLATASLACGAAEPVFWLATALQQDGFDISDIHLVDNDPIALAASTSRAKANDVEALIRIHRRNLLKTPLSEFIAPASVDVVDLIGLFEYLPSSVAGYHMASNLLVAIGEIVRPGGLIVFGNMLNSRPQQSWFEGIWPKLHQRTIESVFDIVSTAGYAVDSVQVRVPSNEGVYAMYAIRVPDDFEPQKLTTRQRALARVVLRSMPEY